jgi:hypothetical protein
MRIRQRVAALSALLLLVSGAVAAHAASEFRGSAGGALLLQLSELPTGWYAVPASADESLKDANDAGPNQAFIQCAGSTPLLDEFDSGPDAEVGNLYGYAHDPSGEPELILGSVAFDDGSVSDAEQAMAAFHGQFPACWAATQDKLNTQQGIIVPVKPSTVTPALVSDYGDDTAAFTVYSDYGRWGDAYEDIVAIREGATIVMLESDSYGYPFPSDTLAAAIATEAQALSAPAQVQHQGKGTSACTSPLLSGAAPLATTASVSAAVGAQLTYQGWTDFGSGSQANYSCQWSGRRVTVPHDPYYRGLNLYVSVRGPFPIGAAKPQFTTDMKQWGVAAPSSGIGQGYFFLPAQDDNQGLEVLCGSAILGVGLSIESPSQLSPHHQIEEQLAKAALPQLGSCSVPIPPPGPTSATGPTSPSPPAGDATCSFTVSPETDPSWVDDLNDDFQSHLHDRLPITVGTINFPGPVYLNFAPGIELTSFDLCASGLVDHLTAEPDGTSDSLIFSAQPAVCGNGSGHHVTGGGSQGGVPCAPRSGAEIDGESTFGQFEYDGDSASWTSVDPKVTPPDQSFTVEWKPSVSVLSGASGSWSAKDGLEANLSLAEIDIASIKATVDLVAAPGVSLEVDYGPSLSFDVQLSNKSLVQSLGSEEAEGETEEKATKQLTQEIREDAQAAVDAEDGGFDLGPSPAEIGAKAQDEIGSDVLEALDSWFGSITADSQVAEALANENILPQDVPADAEAAIATTETPEVTIGSSALTACEDDFADCIVLVAESGG